MKAQRRMITTEHSYASGAGGPLKRLVVCQEKVIKENEECSLCIKGGK